MFSKFGFALLGLAMLAGACSADEVVVEPAATQEAVPEPTQEEATADESAEDVAPPVLAGDYTTETAAELLPVCTSNSFASGLTRSSTGKRTVPFWQQEVGGDFEYEQGALASGSDVAAGFTTTEIDYVACISATGDQAFAIPCDVGGTEFTLIGQTYGVTFYDVHTQEVAGTAVVENAQDCPSFAAITNGEARSATIDRDAMTAAIEAL